VWVGFGPVPELPSPKVQEKEYGWIPPVAVHENETCWPTLAGLGLALADAFSGGGGLILVVFSNETEGAPNTLVISRRKRKGEIKMVDRCIFRTT